MRLLKNAGTHRAIDASEGSVALDAIRSPALDGNEMPRFRLMADEIFGSEKLYCVVETKGTTFVEALREAEQRKIQCAQQHFAALRVSERPAEYRVVTTVDELLIPD